MLLFAVTMPITTYRSRRHSFCSINSLVIVIFLILIVFQQTAGNSILRPLFRDVRVLFYVSHDYRAIRQLEPEHASILAQYAPSTIGFNTIWIHLDKFSEKTRCCSKPGRLENGNWSQAMIVVDAWIRQGLIISLSDFTGKGRLYIYIHI